MDVVSPSSSMCSVASVDRRRRRSSTRRRRQSVCPTSDNQSAKFGGAQATRPPETAAGALRTASWSANFDNLLHDCAGLATFSVSAASNPIALQSLTLVHLRLSGVREIYVNGRRFASECRSMGISSLYGQMVQ